MAIRTMDACEEPLVRYGREEISAETLASCCGFDLAAQIREKGYEVAGYSGGTMASSR